MRSWKYSSAHETWCLQFGDVWQAGSSILAVGDIEQDHAQKVLSTYGPATLMYCDPPWGRNLANSFRSQAGFEGGADYGGVLRKICALAKFTTHQAAFLEMSVRDAGLLEALMRDAGAHTITAAAITYNSGRKPCRLLLGEWGHTPLPLHSTVDPTGMDDNDTPGWAIEHVTSAGDLVFDPCTGIGTTAQAAHLRGRRFLGLEINPVKAAELIAWYSRHGLNPRKIGTL